MRVVRSVVRAHACVVCHRKTRERKAGTGAVGTFRAPHGLPVCGCSRFVCSAGSCMRACCICAVRNEPCSARSRLSRSCASAPGSLGCVLLRDADGARGGEVATLHARCVGSTASSKHLVPHVARRFKDARDTTLCGLHMCINDNLMCCAHLVVDNDICDLPSLVASSKY